MNETVRDRTTRQAWANATSLVFRRLVAVSIGVVVAAAATAAALFIFFLYMVGSHGTTVTNTSPKYFVIPIAIYLVGHILAGVLTGYIARDRGGLHGMVAGAIAGLAFAVKNSPAGVAYNIVDSLTTQNLLSMAVAVALCALGGKLGQALHA